MAIDAQVGRPRGPRSLTATQVEKRQDQIVVWVHVGVFFLLSVGYLLQSPGTYQDDDLDHYFMARAALSQPKFLLDPWGRPAFTALYALPAQVGFGAVRLLTVVLCAGAAWISARVAARIGCRSPSAAAGLTLWQPLFFLLSFSALVEPLAALLLVMVLDSMSRGRAQRGALLAGLLPLARLELSVVAPIVAVWLFRRRALGQAVWLGVPLLAWAVLGGVVHGDALWLPRVVAGTQRPLSTTGPMHYLRNYIAVIGPTAFLGLALGFFAFVRRGPWPRPWMAVILWVVGFGSLTALTSLPVGGSIGFLRHLIVLAPLVSILTLVGFEAALAAAGPGTRWVLLLLAIGIPAAVGLGLSHVLEADYYVRPGRDWSRLIGILPGCILVFLAAARGDRFPKGRAFEAVIQSLTISAALFCFLTVRPIPLNVEQKAVKSALDALRHGGLLSRPLLANHPWVYHLTGRDRWDRAATPYVTRANVAIARPGAVIFWENHYGDRLYGDVSLEELENNPDLRVLLKAESGDKQFRVVVLERR